MQNQSHIRVLQTDSLTMNEALHVQLTFIILIVITEILHFVTCAHLPNASGLVNFAYLCSEIRNKYHLINEFSDIM